MDLSDFRRDYSFTGLSETDLLADPIAQFQIWFSDVLEKDHHDPTAMTLATADRDGRPSARIVLLKGCDERGFVFYTNYNSRKGRELEENPHAALVFYWPDFDRQVRIEGTVERTSPQESEEYFRSRPLGSRLGAWASAQSEVIAGREELEGRLRDLEARFVDGEVPLPDFWGGFRLRPDAVEFWQGRPSRLHDRLRYARLPDGGWKIERLSP
jgi:pyridoxamine 5'-phosphate oxidase